MSEAVATSQQGLVEKYQPYPEYKDSGVEWLGDIPIHWIVRRLKHTASIQSGIPKGKNLTDKTTISVPMLRVANVQDGYLNLDDIHQIDIEPHELERYSLRKGDVLMNEGGDNDKLGRGAVWQGEIEPCIHQNHVFVIRTENIEPEWLQQLMQSSYAKFYFYSVAKQSTNLASISSSNIKETPLFIPPKPERIKVLSFLNYETARIDRLISQQQRLIELLKEKRQAVISHAVTKGLNLDTPMKDSGIEWLGRVPEHWSVGRYKFCNSRIIVGIAEAATHAYVDHGVPLIRSTNIKESGLDCSDVLYLDPAFAAQNFTKKLRAKDIVTVRTGYPGVSAVLPSELDNSQCFTNLVATPLPQQESDFLCEYLNSAVGKSYFDLNAWGSAQKNISVPILQNFPVAWPSKVEQLEIVSFCKKTKQKYNRLIDNAMKGIDLLQERRSALISAAVTGKIDLRGWTPPADEVAA